MMKPKPMTRVETIVNKEGTVSIPPIVVIKQQDTKTVSSDTPIITKLQKGPDSGPADKITVITKTRGSLLLTLYSTVQCLIRTNSLCQ